jgi:hypothetical protein
VDIAFIITAILKVGFASFQTWLKERGGPLFELIAGALGYAKVSSKMITEEAEKAEQSLLELFEHKGWVTEG